MPLLVQSAFNGAEPSLVKLRELMMRSIVRGHWSDSKQTNLLQIVTISMVTCRAVGIGAYLVRLGQRVIQTEPSYIILTGYQALNKVS